MIGKKVVYGFAKYLRDALPSATYLGFTGTPIEKTDVNTPAVFGNYVDIYDIAQAVEDGATVRIFYESRLVKVGLSDEGKKLIAELDEEFDDVGADCIRPEGARNAPLPETQKAKAKWTKMEALIGSEQRIKNIAKDIVAHFEARQEVFAGKGMVVSMSRRIAAELYAEIVKIKPEWQMQQDKLRELAVVLTQKIRENASIDWTIKESVRAKLKVIVKRILRQYGYPPDMQLLATETVLKQAEMIANELVG